METKVNPELPPSPSPQKPAKDGHRELASTIAVIILAPLFALLLTVFAFQSYEVDGPSMESSLQDNDRLIVSKAGRTWSRLVGAHYVPDRYDVVVFHHASSSSQGTQEKQLIKRIIGLPGERVVIKNGDVTIYNAENPGGFAVDKLGPEADVVEYTDGHIDQTVDAGQVFVLGDNRKNSLDSRSFGTIDSNDIVGTLAIRIFPFDSIKKF